MARWPVYRLLIFCCLFYLSTTSCNQAEGPGPAGCEGSEKITGITRESVYDLSGYAGAGGSSPFNLFDENHLFDPLNGESGAPITGTQPKSQSDIYFPLGKGNRIVLDLKMPYQLSKIFLYDHSGSADSVWIYTGDMQNWKLEAAFTTMGEASGWGWRKFDLTHTSQFLMFRFSSPLADVNEVVVYGCPVDKTTGPEKSQLVNKPKVQLKDFLGINMYDEISTEWLTPFKDLRMYAYSISFDSDTVNDYPNNRISISRNGKINAGSFYHFTDSLSALGKNAWYSFIGLSPAMEKKKLNRPVTNIDMDPEDPLSYARHANMMWTLAAAYGKSKVDSNLLLLTDPFRFTGRGTMQIYENGNEDDAPWTGIRYASPLEYFAQSSADYDGHLGRLGKKVGIKNADPGAMLMMSGTSFLDTNRIRVLDFLCKQLRADKKFLWEAGIQYHHYSNNRTTLPKWLQRPGKGITPEEDSLRKRLKAVVDFTKRLQPDIPCILGEYGFDKSQKSWQCTPLLPGSTPAQSQGVMLLRSINAVAFSGMDKMLLYWMKDVEPETSASVFLTSGLVFQKDGKITPYPSWFYINALVHNLGEYIPDSIISERGDVWIYRWKHASKPDSNAYFVYSPGRIGKKVSNHVLEFKVGNGQVVELSFNDQLKTGNLRSLEIKNGKLVIDVEEKPRIFFVQEKKK